MHACVLCCIATKSCWMLKASWRRGSERWKWRERRWKQKPRVDWSKNERWRGLKKTARGDTFLDKESAFRSPPPYALTLKLLTFLLYYGSEDTKQEVGSMQMQFSLVLLIDVGAKQRKQGKTAQDARTVRKGQQIRKMSLDAHVLYQ